MRVKMKRNIVLTVNKVKLDFEVTATLYEKYLDDLNLNNKISASRNFLVRTATKETKPILIDLLDSLPGGALLICGKLVEEYAPDIEITVGE